MADPSRRSTHRLYIDDSGTKEYSETREYHQGLTRHFVLGGVLISHAVAGELSARLQELKEHYFGTAAVEVKSNWMRRPRERRRRYVDAFNVTDEDLISFIDDDYTALLDADFRIIAAVVDKLHMQEEYAKPWYPPAVAYELLVQRAQREMEEQEGYFSVEIDIMSGATPNRRDYGENLRRQHARMKQLGSSLRRGVAFDHLVGNLRFVDSAHSELVQVADIVAYNVFRQFTEYGEEWEAVPGPGASPELPTYEYFSRLIRRFRAGPMGRIQGYGV